MYLPAIQRSPARTPPPTLLFSLNHVKEQIASSRRRRQSREPPNHPVQDRQAPKPSRQPVLPNRAADEPDLSPVLVPVNRPRESFLKLSRRSSKLLPGLSQVKVKQNRSQKRCRFCVDRAGEPKPPGRCWKEPPEEPPNPSDTPSNRRRSWPGSGPRPTRTPVEPAPGLTARNPKGPSWWKETPAAPLTQNITREAPI
jgi:hypothetical protein